MEIKELRKKGKMLKPILSLGKNGLNESSIALISRELEQKELIKIKLLEAAREGVSKQELAQSICTATKATLIELIGHVVVIYKKKPSQPKKDEEDW